MLATETRRAGTQPSVCRVIAAGLLAAITAGGCASRGPAVPAPVPVQTLRSVVPARLPLAAEQLTPTQASQVEYLQLRLRQACMRKSGFGILPGLSRAYIAEGVRITREFDSRWFGVSDPTAIAAFGYHVPAWTAGSASARSGPPPPAELSVLNGTVQAYRGQPVPAGGCLGRAAAELSRAGIGSAAQQSGGHWPGSLASGLEHAAFDRAQSDARVRAVFAKWSACMRAHGYAYRTPFDAGSDPRWLARTAPSRAEILTAQRDLGCKLRVNLIGVEFAVISDYENLGMAQDPGAITAASTAVRSEAAAIKRAMARYGT